MIPGEILFKVGWGAVGVLVVAWLVVSFSRGALRDRLARLATVAMYTALVCLFTSGLQGAEGWLGRGGFGFLVVLFGAGLLVSLWKLLRTGAAGGEHAAH
ncbi:MAG: hypothetical protein CL910_00970 [Deltaproteobacteria bacterium]|jgi:hypothetical protein|nr:hypothetical protein [Deltaproteobacteria bacterium]